MRSHLAAIGLAILTLASPLKAELSEANEALISEDLLADSNTQEEERMGNWNQWICYARAPGYYRPFVGASYYFQAGSGEGQEARRFAHLVATRQCEYYTQRQCRSNFNRDCYVVR